MRDPIIMAGQDYTLTATCKADNVAVNLSGYTVEFRLGDALRQAMEVSRSATVTDAAAGEVSIALTDTETKDLDGKYDWQFIITTGSTTTVGAQGYLRVKPLIPASNTYA